MSVEQQFTYGHQQYASRQDEPDPDRREQAWFDVQAAEAACTLAARELDATEGQARNGQVDRAALREATLREEGARDRLDQARRAYEELQVVEILTDAADHLHRLAAEIDAAEQAAAAELVRLAAGFRDLNLARAQLDYELGEATQDLPMRLHLTGNTDRYRDLPAAVPDSEARLTRLAAHAARAPQ